MLEIDVPGFFRAVLTYTDDRSGGLTAIAALIGIPLLLFQIFQGARQERGRAHARRYAALAALPMTLSGVNRWAKDVAQSLKAIDPWLKGTERDQPAPAFDPPPSPDHLISAIEQMIEAAQGGYISKILAAIVSDIQVLNSRISDAKNYKGRHLRIETSMIDSNLFIAARIYARAESLYDASRSLSNNVPVDYSRVRSALHNMGIHEQDLPARSSVYPTVHQMIERAHQKQISRKRRYKKICDAISERWAAPSSTARRTKR
ncbi:hypothetical protein [Sphingomonas flavalba]|uniref:hypothetical protein n=1 Tax=Sphingomonas flavalba TaxID=2559804 RepID=UPI00109DB029|nr:hypothetical protein [Sphingomonas flavalba]